MNNTNKKLIPILVILIILLALFFVGRAKTKPQTTIQEVAAPQSSNTNKDDSSLFSSFSGSLKDLVQKGAAKCTYTSDKISGTTYSDGKNIRSDSEITLDDGKKMEGHMISDGTWAYSWSSAIPQGVKFNLEKMKESTSSANTNNDAVKNFEQKFDFKCSKWPVDASKFVVPTDVQFTDLSQMMTPPADGKPSGTSSMCAACNYIQNAADKASCVQRFCSQ